MSKRPTAKAMDRAKKRAYKALCYWKPLVGLGTWKITMRWYRRIKDVPKAHRGEDAAGWGAAMWCEVQWPYMLATIGVVLPRIADESADDIAMMVRHELLHAVVGEMREWMDHPAEHAIDHEERVVCMLTSALMWVRTAGRDEGASKKSKKVKESLKP